MYGAPSFFHGSEGLGKPPQHEEAEEELALDVGGEEELALDVGG